MEGIMEGWGGIQRKHNRGSRLKLSNQKVQISRDCTRAPWWLFVLSKFLSAARHHVAAVHQSVYELACTTGASSFDASGKPILSTFHPLRVTTVWMAMVWLFPPFVCFLALSLCLVSLPRRLKPSSASAIRPTGSSSARRHTAHQLHSGPQALPFCLPLCVGVSEIVLHLFQFCLSTCITTCSRSAQRATKEPERFKPSCSLVLLSAEVEIK